MNNNVSEKRQKKSGLFFLLVIFITCFHVASASDAAEYRILPIWFGDSNQGGGAAIGYIDGNKDPDVAILNIDDPGDQNIPYLRFGFNLNSEGYTDDWTKEVRIPIWMGEETAAADIAISDINNNGKPDMVFFNIDNAEGENRAYYCIGWDLTVNQADKNKKTVDITWDSHVMDPIPIPGWIGEDTDAGGIALADLNGNNIKDLIVFHMDDRTGSFFHPSGDNNKGFYKIGWDMDKNGEVTWNTASRTEQPFGILGWGLGHETEGGDIAVSDLNNNGIPDITVYYVDNPEGDNVGYYTTGWDICNKSSCLGEAQKWDWPQKIPGWFGEETTGASIDILNKLSNGGSNFYIFRVGKNIGSWNVGLIGTDIKGLKGIYSIFPISSVRTTFGSSDIKKNEQSLVTENQGMNKPEPSSSVELSGIWNCDDKGIYYIVQKGSDVYWYGEEKDLDPRWSNIAYGTIEGDTVTLKWIDIPKGRERQNGDLTLKVSESKGTDAVRTLTATKKTGNFGGSVWTKKNT